MTDDNQELLRILEELERRKRDCPIAGFKPHVGQERTLQAMVLKAIVMALAGNRWGKTELAVALAIATALGYRPWEVPGLQLIEDPDNKRGWNFPPRETVPYEAWVTRADGLPIAVPNRSIFVTGLDLSRGIGEIVQPKFCSLWPMHRVHLDTYLYKLGTWRKIHYPNGSEMTFASAQQDRMSFEGFAADAAFGDEPFPRHVYTALKRGLVDKHGRLLWTMTPLGDSDIAWIAADILGGERQDVAVIFGSGYDNPYIDHEALKAYLEDPALTEAERRARTTGEITAIGKRIVTTFDPATCVIPPTDIPAHIPRILVIDPHHSRPPCCLWIAVFDDGERLVAYREWPTEDVEKAGPRPISNHDLAGLIKSLEGRENVVWRLADPQFGRAHATVHGERFQSFAEAMGQYGLGIDTRVDNDLDRGIAKLRDAFRLSSVTNRPRLSIMAHLTNTINSLQLWSYRENESGKLVVGEQYKDFADCARYAVQYSLPIFSNEGGYSYLDKE